MAEERYTVCLISPANLGGQRAKLALDPKADFEVARRLRSSEGAPLGEVFTFVSGLYFRGKRTYAEVFGRPPPSLTGGLVISPSEGLRRLEEHVTRERLLAWAEVSIADGNPLFTGPLIDQAAAMERARRAYPLRPPRQRGHRQVRRPADGGARRAAALPGGLRRSRRDEPRSFAAAIRSNRDRAARGLPVSLRPASMGHASWRGDKVSGPRVAPG